MAILGEIKAYVAGAVLLVIGVLAAAVRHFRRQRNDARQESERLRRRAEAVAEQRRREMAVHNASNEARKKARENAKAEQERIDNDIRPTHWGDRRFRVRTKKD